MVHTHKVGGSIPPITTKEKTALLLVFKTSLKSFTFTLVFSFSDQTQLAFHWRVGRYFLVWLRKCLLTALLLVFKTLISPRKNQAYIVILSKGAKRLLSKNLINQAYPFRSFDFAHYWGSPKVLVAFGEKEQTNEW